LHESNQTNLTKDTAGTSWEWSAQ